MAITRADLPALFFALAMTAMSASGETLSNGNGMQDLAPALAPHLALEIGGIGLAQSSLKLPTFAAPHLDDHFDALQTGRTEQRRYAVSSAPGASVPFAKAARITIENLLNATPVSTVTDDRKISLVPAPDDRKSAGPQPAHPAPLMFLNAYLLVTLLAVCACIATGMALAERHFVIGRRNG